MSTDLTGGTVISWDDKEPVTYGGENDHPDMTSLSFSLRHGGLPVLKCAPDRVAPIGTPIPDQDERVQVTKLPKKPYAWVAGPWELRVAGIDHVSYHRIKRDAVTTGLRRVAILDWHAAQARLEYLRGEIRAERISYSEIADLQGLVPFIDSGDTELLEWAGVPEH